MQVGRQGNSALRLEWATHFIMKKSGRGKDCLLQVDTDADVRHTALDPPSYLAGKCLTLEWW